MAIAFGRFVNVQKGEQDELSEAAAKLFIGLQEGQKFSLQTFEFILRKCICIAIAYILTTCSISCYLSTANFPFLEPLIEQLILHSDGGSAFKVLYDTVISLVQARRETGESTKVCLVTICMYVTNRK